MNAIALPSTRRGTRLGKIASFALPVAISALAASAAYAGADTTFAPALAKFTDFLEGSGGKIITVLTGLDLELAPGTGPDDEVLQQAAGGNAGFELCIGNGIGMAANIAR